MTCAPASLHILLKVTFELLAGPTVRQAAAVLCCKDTMLTMEQQYERVLHMLWTPGQPCHGKPIELARAVACREDLDAASQEAEIQACNCEVNCRSDNLSSSTSESSLCLQVYYSCMPTLHAIQSNTLLAAKISHSWTDNICMHGPRLELYEITAYTFPFWGCQPLKLALTQSHMYMTHTDLCLPILCVRS